MTTRPTSRPSSRPTSFVELLRYVLKTDAISAIRDKPNDTSPETYALATKIDEAPVASAKELLPPRTVDRDLRLRAQFAATAFKILGVDAHSLLKSALHFAQQKGSVSDEELRAFIFETLTKQYDGSVVATLAKELAARTHN